MRDKVGTVLLSNDGGQLMQDYLAGLLVGSLTVFCLFMYVRRWE